MDGIGTFPLSRVLSVADAIVKLAVEAPRAPAIIQEQIQEALGHTGWSRPPLQCGAMMCVHSHEYS